MDGTPFQVDGWSNFFRHEQHPNINTSIIVNTIAYQKLASRIPIGYGSLTLLIVYFLLSVRRY